MPRFVFICRGKRRCLFQSSAGKFNIYYILPKRIKDSNSQTAYIIICIFFSFSVWCVDCAGSVGGESSKHAYAHARTRGARRQSHWNARTHGHARRLQPHIVHYIHHMYELVYHTPHPTRPHRSDIARGCSFPLLDSPRGTINCLSAIPRATLYFTLCMCVLCMVSFSSRLPCIVRPARRLV